MRAPPVKDFSVYDPARCLRSAAGRLASLRLLATETPPSDPLCRLVHTMAGLKVDARTYLRLCVLAGRARKRRRRR